MGGPIPLTEHGIVAQRQSNEFATIYSFMEQTCKHCQRVYLYDRKKGHRKQACNTCLVDIRRKQRDNKMYDYKGGPCCSRCGYNKCKAALCFHHEDPSTKEFQISGNWGLSWEKTKLELDKCILVCANCHAEIHMES